MAASCAAGGAGRRPGEEFGERADGHHVDFDELRAGFRQRAVERGLEILDARHPPMRQSERRASRPKSGVCRSA